MTEPDDNQSKSRIQLPILPLMATAPWLSVVRDQAKPRKLGRYELEECLGNEGGIETYRARVRGLAGFDRIFAVKCLSRGRGTPINLNDPFIKTAKRTATVVDPRVARVLDAAVIDGVAIAVTEFVHGLDLDRFREWAQVSGVLATGGDENAEKWQKIVAYVGAEVAEALAAIHALSPPLVHGGLCPRNIIATARGGIKVVDVGLRQAARGANEAVSARALAYAGPETSAAEPSPESDVRALGAVLFELATGEPPAPDAGSLAARKILDTLWPSLADFIAGLLAEDPALRPSAKEAAKILAGHCSDIPDASMVAEMASLVHNFSAFVADSSTPHTPQPLPAELGQADPAPMFRPVAPAVPPPSPRAPSASGSFLAAGNEPTRAVPSGSYASTILQSRAAAASTPSFPGNPRPMAPPAAPTGGGSFPEAASPVIEPPALMSPEPGDQLALPPTQEGSFDGPDNDDFAPSAEVADWGARALAALGDQAGVEVLPLALAPAAGTSDGAPGIGAPPPVSDPVIEEAFAFLPPPPAELKPAPAGNTLGAGERYRPNRAPVRPVTHQRLEDELIDEGQDPGAIMASAFEPPATDSAPPSVRSAEGSAVASAEDGAEARGTLEATAFESEEGTGADREWSPPRLAHAMPAPEVAPIRRPSARTAVNAEGDIEDGEPDDENWETGPSRARRIAIVLAAVVLLGGIAAVAVVTLAPKGKKTSPPPFLAQPFRSSKGVTPSIQAAKQGVGKLRKNVPATEKPGAKPVATASQPRATPGTAKVSNKPAPAAPSGRTAPTAAASSAAPIATVPTVSAVAANEAASGAGAIGLSIATEPAGAMVWIDGRERGTTPCTVKLKSGSARLVLVHAGYLTSQSTVEVRAGAKANVTLKPVAPPMNGDARFRAECKTQGKLPVVVDGKETGILCPYSKMRVDPGRHTIGLLVPGTGKVHAKEITLSAGVRSITFGD